ncbi:retrovirus-related pol polyprotein from transposon TNT 1-94 [Tanacetum coccineum]
MEVLHTLHMDLCGPMRVQNNGIEFVNQVLTELYESVGIFHQKSVLRTPQQNDIVKRQNSTLVEAAWTMLIFSKALMFLWEEAVATACGQNVRYQGLASNEALKGRNCFNTRSFFKDMDQDSAHMVAASKVLILKPENGATLPKTTTVEGVVTEMPITTVEEKAQRRLEDAKKLLEAVEKRFSGNEATKKTQRKDFTRRYNGIEFVNQVLTELYESVGIFHQKSVLRTPQQNDIVKRQNSTLVEAAWTMLIFSKALMFLWEEAVATAFFGALCYPTNDSEDLEKLKATADIGIFVGYAPNGKGYRIYNKRTRRIMETIHLSSSSFSAGTPSSTTIGQDAPSTSHSPSSSKVQPPISHQGITAGPTIKDNPFAQAKDNPFVNVFAPEPSSEESSSGDVSSTEST